MAICSVQSGAWAGIPLAASVGSPGTPEGSSGWALEGLEASHTCVTHELAPSQVHQEPAAMFSFLEPFRGLFISRLRLWSSEHTRCTYSPFLLSSFVLLITKSSFIVVTQIVPPMFENMKAVWNSKS